MTIDQAQKTVDNWIHTYGVRYFSELTNMAILTEEVGEVARIMARRYGEQTEKESFELDFTNQPNGTYLVKILDANNESRIVKVVNQN